MRKLFQVVVVGLILVPSVCAANPKDARAARAMWSAFNCSIFAEIKGDKIEQERLFKVGYEAGQQFLAAVQAGTISAEEANAIIPVGVMLNMGGPTIDFVLGKMFAAASGEGYDEVVTKGPDGLSLPVEKWVMDEELQSSIASLKYLKANCQLL